MTDQGFDDVRVADQSDLLLAVPLRQRRRGFEVSVMKGAMELLGHRNWWMPSWLITCARVMFIVWFHDLR